MSDSASNPSNSPAGEGDRIEISIQLDRDLVEQVSHLSSDAGKVIEVALRQWLRGGQRREDDLSRPLPDNPVVPAKGEWND